MREGREHIYLQEKSRVQILLDFKILYLRNPLTEKLIICHDVSAWIYRKYLVPRSFLSDFKILYLYNPLT